MGWWLLALGCLALGNNFLSGGVAYSDDQLWSAGRSFEEVRVAWKAEQKLHQERLSMIDSSNLPEGKKGKLRKMEMGRHNLESYHLAQKRNAVHNILINETNARARKGKGPSNAEVDRTLGTGIDDPGHQKMRGDLDVGGGSNTARKMQDVLKDMGLDHIPVVDKPGTLEIGGDFELTMNKTGLAPKPGSEFHRIKTEVDALNPETYLSYSMKDPETGRKHAGHDYVEVQDHRKKANKGLMESPDNLVRNPDKMKAVAKGTAKTLDLDNLPPSDVQKIMDDLGIEGTPQSFKNKLQNIKEGIRTVTDTTEAAKIKKASEKIFDAAEARAFDKAKQEIVRLREKAATMPDGPDKLKIQEEIVDSVAKMKSSKNANDLAKNRPDTYKKTIAANAAEDVARTRSLSPDAELDSIRPVQDPGVKAKAAKVFSAIMDFGDIADTCRTVEDYVDGKIGMDEVALRLVDQHLTAGLIATGRRAGESYDDYQASRQSTRDANRSNMEAYLTQWEICLRKGGLPANEARALVGRAMISGKLEILEDKAAALRARGKEVKTPQLVVESYEEADRNLGERIVDTGTGMVTSIGENMVYLISAPTRVVNAWSEGELKEADLEKYAAERTAEARVEIFRKLVGENLDSRSVLAALDAFEAGRPQALKQLFAEAKVRKQERELTERELAAAEQAARDAEQAMVDLQRDLALHSRLLTLLARSSFTLKCRPNPVIPEESGKREKLELYVEIGGNLRYLPQILARWEEVLQRLGGTSVKVKVDFEFSCPVREEQDFGHFFTGSPTVPGVYPISVTMRVQASGGNLAAEYPDLTTQLNREAMVSLDVGIPGDREEGEVWEVLRMTPVVAITYKYYYGTMENLGVSRRMDFRTTVRSEDGRRREHHFELDLSPDARWISLKEERENYEPGGRLESKEIIQIPKMKLYSFDKADASHAAQVYYTPEYENRICGTMKSAWNHPENGLQWAEETPLSYDSSTAYRPFIHFYMLDEEKEKRRLARRELAAEKKEQRETAREEAAAGKHYKGTFGEDQEMEGSMELDINADKKRVVGKFRGTRVISETRKMVISGEFQGTIDPASGEIQGSLVKSAIMSMLFKEGKWYPASTVDSFSSDTRVKGKLENSRASGCFILKGREGFLWTASLPENINPKGT